MKTRDDRLDNRGYSLVEVLVATAVMGVVIAGIYASYLGMQRTTYTQEEVVDVQQNLRIALETITRDIKMAGIGLPKSALRVADTSTGAVLNLASATANYDFARLSAEQSISSTSTEETLSVASPGMVDQFATGNKVRIIRPQDGNQPLDLALEVAGVNRTAQTITLKNFSTASEVLLVPGDLIVKTEAYPTTISYSLADNTIFRSVNGGAGKILADNVTALAFTYLLDDGTETDTPSDFSTVRAVRVTIDGQNLRTDAFAGNTKTRRISSVAKLRNR